MLLDDAGVKRMFQEVAFSYDVQNSVLSLRRDSCWRRTLARRLPEGRPLRVLDVASGTAEIALAVCRARPQAVVTGLDYSPAMLAKGQAKAAARGLHARLRLLPGDARNLPVADASLDAVTIAFGIRNVDDRAKALAEFHRVLRPGGQVLVMEFSLPASPLLRRLYRLYLDHFLPPLGNLLARSSYAYDYLRDSVHAFPEPEAFKAEFADAGFADVTATPLTYGIAQLYEGTKREIKNEDASGGRGH